MYQTISKGVSDRLELIRGVSALVVLVAHLQQIFILPSLGLEHPLRWIGSGVAAYAVMSFFVLSGFLITTSIYRNRSLNNGEFKPEIFLKARLRRIYPPLIVSLLLSLFIYQIIFQLDLHGNQAFALQGDLYVVREKVAFAWTNWLSNLFLLQGVAWGHPIVLNGPLWSISYEWWYYLLAMLSFMGIANRSYLLGFVPLVLVLALLGYQGKYTFLVLGTVWAQGMLLAVAYHKQWLKTNGFRWVMVGQAVLAASFACFWVQRKGASVMLPSDLLDARIFLAASASVLPLYFAILLRSSVTPFRSPIAKLFCGSAGYSYTLYVLHFPLLILSFSLLHPVLHGRGWLPLLSCVALIGVAVILLCSRVARWVEPSPKH